MKNTIIDNNNMTTTNIGAKQQQQKHLNQTNAGQSTALFSEQVSTVTNLFEKWNDCERTVVMYALLKRLRYPSLKFLQYSIDNNLTQNLNSQSNLSTVVIDLNANNSSYLQNLLNAYKTSHHSDVFTEISSASSDKDSIPCYGSDFQMTNCEERKLNAKKEELLHEVLDMLPLLKPTNDDAKQIYLTLIPLAVKDTMHQIVPTELVQQIFSYLLIHPALTSDDRKSLNIWLRHLEEHIQTANTTNIDQTNQSFYFGTSQTGSTDALNAKMDGVSMLTTSTLTTSCSASSTSSSSAASCSSASNVSVASSVGGSSAGCNLSTSIPTTTRNADWQTIAPPSKQQSLQQAAKKLQHDWPTKTNGGSIADQLCDNLNGITLNELASSQNSLRLSLGGADTSTLVNGVVAAAAATAAKPNSLFSTNPIINIINNSSNSSSSSNNNSNTNSSCNNSLNVGGISSDDHDTSFSRNGTEIIDFEPTNHFNACEGFNHGSNNSSATQLHHLQQPLGYASILLGNFDQMEMNRWSLDSKLAALKTRRSNSLTTQTISLSSSSSNSSVITVNDNCSNSTENLAQFCNKPRSFSLSIEHQRSGLTNGGSDTRLDDFKPSYIKFQTRNVGMSGIGLWLKSLRLHKYIELFKNMTYEEMLQISEEFLQSLGVTKGASHKLALCIEKLKERGYQLRKMEQDLLSGHMKVATAVEELANIVLTPMKPVETVNTNSGEENVALHFLKMLDLVCSLTKKDPYASQDDDSITVIMWILDRSIHNEAFLNHANQLKELKFKLSKLKMSIPPKMHHIKNNSTGSLNKPRWNGKIRKGDSKNGSNDRINHRKNSNDMLSMALNCAVQQHHQQQQQQQQQHEFEHHHSSNNKSGGNQPPQQYKSSSYPNFMKHQQQQQQQQQQHHHHHSQPQQQQHQEQQQPALPNHLITFHVPHSHTQHRRSLNNLILVSGGPQQPKNMIFKPGQGILPATAAAGTTTTTTTTVESLENALKQQQRRASFTAANNNSLATAAAAFTHVGTIGYTTNAEKQQQQQPHKMKNSIASIVMKNFSKFDQQFKLF